ncbi:hypothetical protein [Paenibacillus sp.]|jgi:hypothetical protein|uniref:hypothetical protein n=1 Tax=Paenibacillus sp. TaxID=58172 RepID=UPI002831A6D8|nr:hypothetical protein [Paenibacillus sp.]MDR0268242.1 hypothetical protein [Paenibacillus sp.]
MSEEYKTETDLTYERYANAGDHPVKDGLPKNDLRDVNTQTVQSISAVPEPSNANIYTHSDISPELSVRHVPEEPLQSAVGDIDDGELEDVPDADQIQEDSPADPIAVVEDMHGTDLINGFDGDETE